MKKVLALVLALCLALAVAPVLADEANVLRFGTEAEPIGFDPHTISAVASLRVINQLYNQLVDVDENMNIIPELAASWEQPSDTVYVFHLVENAYFHNGRNVTAEDVKYSFERVLNPDTAALGNSDSYIKCISAIDVLDTYTVQLTLSAINASFLNNLSSTYCSIVCKEVVEENGDLLRADGGTGPYTLGEWLPDNYVTVNAFDKYFDDATKATFDTVEFYVMADASARIAALRTGNVDIIKADETMLDLVEANDDIAVTSFGTRNYAGLFFQLTREPFTNEKVRQAINLALNRQEIIDFAYNGTAMVSGFVPSSLGHWAVDVNENEYYTQNIEKAKQLMAEAGYPDGFSCTLTVGLLDSLRDMGAVVQQQLSEIGIQVEVINKENAEYVDDWSNHNFDIMACQNGAGSDPSRGVAFFFKTGSSANIQDYSNARVDELCELGAGTTDDAAREAYYKEAINLILDECAVAIVACPNEYYLNSTAVQNFAPNASSPYTLAGVTLSK